MLNPKHLLSALLLVALSYSYSTAQSRTIKISFGGEIMDPKQYLELPVSPEVEVKVYDGEVPSDSLEIWTWDFSLARESRAVRTMKFRGETATLDLSKAKPGDYLVFKISRIYKTEADGSKNEFKLPPRPIYTFRVKPEEDID